MGSSEQTIVMTEIRQLKKNQKEQDERIANLELKGNVNGATILKAISEFSKENREEHKMLRKEMHNLQERMSGLEADNKGIHKELNDLHEDNKNIHKELNDLHEDNKNIHKELNDLHEDNKGIHEELLRINSKLDLMVELFSKHS